MLNIQNIKSRIDSKSILVVGDIMVDNYFTGYVNRISPEAPVPVFKKNTERSVLGGAANAASNLIAAGQMVSILSIIGRDEYGKLLKSMLDSSNINTDLLFELDRETTVKTRFLAGNNQQVMRLDIENSDPISSDECEMIMDRLKQISNVQFDLVLISDYLKGLLTPEFTQNIIQLFKNKNIPVIIDVKDKNTTKYKDATLLKPNLKELQELTGKKASTDEETIKASLYLKNICNVKYVLTTCGSRGMVLVGGEVPYFIDSVGHEVFDVTGAGDTTIAYLATCMANGLEMNDAVDIANYAAGIQVSKVGTSSVSWEELSEYLLPKYKISLSKIIKNEDITILRNDLLGKKIVFTNGCFDILHVGHLRYLQEAAKMGDVLVIGLNSDDSVRRLKGQGRPINNQDDRAEMLAALEFVDYVVIFDEDTPYELIKKIQPDILVKGGDYNLNNVVGKDIVEARGGELRLLDFVEGKSTTNIINRIKKQ